MVKLNRSALLIAAAAVFVLPLGACAGKKAKGDTAYVARDVNTLYSLAKKSADQGNYADAAKLFDEVERQHPYSVWARRAQMMSAFSYYMAQQYSDSISSSQRFLTIHPGNSDAPYANYLIAMSYYQQIADVTRDQKITQQASDAFGELIRRYPGSRYATDARLKLDLINDHLAGKEMDRATGSPPRSASAPSSTNIRPPATPPKRSSGWSNAIWRSACPKRRAKPARCWGATIPARSGTSAAMRCFGATSPRPDRHRAA
jgi:outer membrane assembly lipoprotein YfiO